jgi:cytochrome P450
MLRDPVTYPSPEEFKPERFLTADGKALNPNVPFPDPAFGFARRTCPGRAMGLSSLSIAITSILAAFDIKKAAGDDGELITPKVD